MTPPKIYILIENPSKSNNLGPILRCGAAFCATFIFVGYQKCAYDGSHGAHKHVEILSFPTFQQAVDYIKKSCRVKSIVGILGDVTFRSKGGYDDDNGSKRVRCDLDHGKNNVLRVSSSPAQPWSNDKNNGIINNNSTSDEEINHQEIYPCSEPIHTRPFAKNENICFLIHKKSSGLPAEQGAYCDAFVHISTGAPILTSSTNDDDGTLYGLLDCQTCLSICLHHFAAFAGYKERDFVGQKFQVANLHVSLSDIDRNDEKYRAIKEERRQRKMQMEKDAQEAWENDDQVHGMLHLFGER